MDSNYKEVEVKGLKYSVWVSFNYYGSEAPGSDFEKIYETNNLDEAETCVFFLKLLKSISFYKTLFLKIKERIDVTDLTEDTKK